MDCFGVRRSLSFSPPIIRFNSLVFSSGLSSVIMTAVLAWMTVFSILKCVVAWVAIWGRWVMTMVWLVLAI